MLPEGKHWNLSFTSWLFFRIEEGKNSYGKYSLPHQDLHDFEPHFEL
jgi:hypothetical protein